MSVLGILKMSGALPLNELNLRSSGSPAQLTQELRRLMDAKLVDFDGALPDPEAVPSETKPVQLTLKGLRAAPL